MLYAVVAIVSFVAGGLTVAALFEDRQSKPRTGYLACTRPDYSEGA